MLRDLSDTVPIPEEEGEEEEEVSLLHERDFFPLETSEEEEEGLPVNEGATAEEAERAETAEEQRLRSLLVPGRTVWFDLDEDFRLRPEGEGPLAPHNTTLSYNTTVTSHNTPPSHNAVTQQSVSVCGSVVAAPETERETQTDTHVQKARRRGPPARLLSYNGQKTLRNARRARESEGDGGEEEEGVSEREQHTHSHTQQEETHNTDTHNTLDSHNAHTQSHALSREERQRLLQDVSWADFSLGEDVRDERRRTQDALWAQAVADGRTHLSHREFAVEHRPRFVQAIEFYDIVDSLVLGMYSAKARFLPRLNEELLALIVEFAFPGQAPLVHFLSKIQQHMLALRGTQDTHLDIDADNRIISNVNANAEEHAVMENATESASCVDTHSTEGEEEESPFRLCARIRPLLPAETALRSCYEVVRAPSLTQSPAACERVCVLHEGRLARSGRSLSMTHHFCSLHRVYPPECETRVLCEESLRPLCERALRERAQATLLCFGQTGTGKTHTLYGALHYLAHYLTTTAIDVAPHNAHAHIQAVRVMFYEIRGKACFDLLRGRAPVHLRTDAQGQVHVRGARCVALSYPLSSASELLEVLAEGLTLRASEVTERNDMSSRSHAVCVVEVIEREIHTDTHKPAHKTGMSLGEYLERGKAKEDLPHDNSHSTHDAHHTHNSHTAHENAHKHVCGRLTLVDLAGSERNYETTQMSAAQHKESAEINLSLMTLKNCFRAFHDNLRAQQQWRKEVNEWEKQPHQTKKKPQPPTLHRVPFRGSTLTKVLKDCFIVPSQHGAVDLSQLHYTTIIATLSPTPTDLQHSLNTIHHVLLMCPSLRDRYYATQTVEVPKTSLSALSTQHISLWTHAQVQAWLATVDRGKFSHLALPWHVDGKALLGMTASSFAELFVEQERVGRQESEGPVWTISVEETRRLNNISNALVRAIRREEALGVQLNKLR